MLCKIDGCGRAVDYKAAQLCQKHYFRQRRNGHTDLVLDLKRAKLGFSRQQRVVMPGRGYIRVYAPDHPLTDSGGYVAEHRRVVFDRYGNNLPPCELCGKPMAWENDIHIDHRDDDPSNNHQDNLRPLCRPCNTFRSYPERHTFKRNMAITFDGETKTPNEWAKDARVKVCGHQIALRKRSGMSDYDALFSEKKTHNGNPRVDLRKRKTECKSERSNAVAITIDGVTMTAAEWSRHPECKISRAGIVWRVRRGMMGKDAVFKELKASHD